MGIMITKIPIFITARGHNKEEFDKNKECLKFAYIFISKQNLFDQTFIISDNKELLDYALKLGFTKTIHYECKNSNDIKYLEYLATYTYGKENNYYPDWIIILNINQIFRSYSLISDCINNIDDNYDIITSYTEINNKSHFFISTLEKDKHNLSHLLSNELDIQHMADASIYAVRSKFAFECMEYDDPSEHFWKGRIKFFKNKSVYVDIRNIDHIKQYYNIRNVLNEAKNMNVI